MSQPLANAEVPRSPIAVVFDNARASGSFEDRLGDVLALHCEGFKLTQGVLAGRRIIVLALGENLGQAASSVEALIIGHRPRWIIAAGLAHGLTDPLRREDAVVASSIVGDSVQNAVSIEVPSPVMAMAGVKSGRLASTSQSLRLPEEKRALGEHSGAIAADRSALAICSVCQRERIACFAVHVVADAVDDRLPADVAHWAARPSLAQRLGAMAGAIVHRPGSAKDMWNYFESTVAASAKLADRLTEIVRVLG